MNSIPSASHFCYRNTLYSKHKNTIEQTNEYLNGKDYQFIDVFWQSFVDYKTHGNVDQLKESLLPIHKKLSFIDDLVFYVTTETDKVVAEEKSFASQNIIGQSLDTEINDFKQNPTAQKAIALHFKIFSLIKTYSNDLKNQSMANDTKAFFSYVYYSIEESKQIFYSIIDEHNTLRNEIYEFDGHAFTHMNFIGKGRFKNKPNQLFCRKKKVIPDNSNAINLGGIVCPKCFERFVTQLFD